ncbi:MAG TPA: hypothetical protein VMD28_09960, partial [Acidimicrobiales bacterium]|nr:hypothetical protein [Acidimicrobiales bacterium]
DALRVKRAEAVEILVDLQRRIAAAVEMPEPDRDGEPDSVGGDGVESRLDGQDGDDIGGTGLEETTVVPAVGAPLAKRQSPAPSHSGPGGDAGPTAAGVLVTDAPTTVQPAAGRGDGGSAPAGRRRRSA